MRETSLLVDYLSVTIITMPKMPKWFAGLLRTEARGNLKFIFLFPGCWGTLMGNPQCCLSLDQSPAPSGWTMCNARATKIHSLTALISLWMIVVPLRGQASSAQILVCYNIFLTTLKNPKKAKSWRLTPTII